MGPLTWGSVSSSGKRSFPEGVKQDPFHSPLPWYLPSTYHLEVHTPHCLPMGEETVSLRLKTSLLPCRPGSSLKPSSPPSAS